MTEEDFEKYLSHSVKLNESPVSSIITVDEQNAGWFDCEEDQLLHMREMLWFKLSIAWLSRVAYL